MKRFLILFSIFTFFTCLSANADTVVFNTKTYKIHSLWCRYVQACTVNCIKIERKDAVKRGGVLCKVCGGR